MSCPSSSKSTRKRKLQTSECEKPSKKRMAWESFTSIEHFGYKFNEEGRLVNIQDGSGFNFYVDEQDHWHNQKNYEALGEVITEYIYELLQSENVGLKKLEIPQEKVSSKKQKNKDEAKGFIFVSEDFDKKDKLLVLVHGSGVVRAGQWARRLIINDCLDHGTQIPYIKRAIKDGYGVVVTNTNQNNAFVEIKGKKTYKSIKESESPERHFSYVWKNIIEKTSASKIFAVAHSYGGYLVVNYFARFPKILERVVAVAFTDSVHSLNSDSRAEVRKWFLENSVNWATSDNDLDTPMYHQDDKNHITRVSAGTTRHEETSWKAMESVFEYFQNQELDFDKKKMEVGKCEGNSSKNKKKRRRKKNACKFSNTEKTKEFNNEESTEKDVITSELLDTGNNSYELSTESGEEENSNKLKANSNLNEEQGGSISYSEADQKKSEKSTGKDGMNEYVDGEEASKNVEEIRKNDAKTEDGSDLDNVSHDEKGTKAVEMSKKASDESKSSEQKSEDDLDKDALKSEPETSEEFKGKNMESSHKNPENSSGEDGKNEYKESGEALKNTEEMKDNGAIASESSKAGDNSEPGKINDDKNGTNAVEISDEASEESSEQESKGDLDGDTAKTGPETPDEVKDKSNNEAGNNKLEISPGKDGKNEYKEGEEALKNIKEVKGSDAIACESSKTEDGSEPDKASDETKEEIAAEISTEANKETKSSEENAEGDFDKDGLKSGPEIKGTSNNDTGNNESERSPGQDEKNKSVEGEDEMVKNGEDLNKEIHVECVDSETNSATENQPTESAASNRNGVANTIDPKCNEPSDEVVGSQKEQTDNNSENSGDDPSKADASSTNDQHEKKLETDKVEKKPSEASSEDKLPKDVSLKQENVDKTSNSQDETVNNAGKSTTSQEGKNEGDQATPDAPDGIGENLGTDSFNSMPETFIV